MRVYIPLSIKNHSSKKNKTYIDKKSFGVKKGNVLYAPNIFILINKNHIDSIVFQ